jgi:hypothetical protein
MVCRRKVGTGFAASPGARGSLGDILIGRFADSGVNEKLRAQGAAALWNLWFASHFRFLGLAVLRHSWNPSAPYGPNPSPRPLERERYPNNREAIAKDSPVGAKAGELLWGNGV